MVFQRTHVVTRIGGMAVLCFVCAGPSTTGADELSSQPETPHLVQSARAVWRGPSLCVSCDLAREFFYDHFWRFALGESVSAWFPIDVDSDGTWELALELAGPQRLFGVFDPQTESWLDGPRALPVLGYYLNVDGMVGWGAGDFDGDGFIEYVYIDYLQDSLRLLDTRTGIDRSLWPIGFLPLALWVWGHDGSGSPTVALLKARADVGEGYNDSYWDWLVYTLDSPAAVVIVPGGYGFNRRLFGYPSATSVSLAVHYGRWSYQHNDEPGIPDIAWVDQELHIVDEMWSQIASVDLPKWSPFQVPLISGAWKLVSANASPAGTGSSGMIYWLGGPTSGGYPPKCLGTNRFNSYNPLWSETSWPSDTYAGIAGFDLNQDGQEELILPLTDGSGWERRDPLTGSIVDTIPGMPATDLYIGPILNAGQRELFFVADSGLYVLMPEMITGVVDTQSVETIPARMTLTAAPNPFNAAVILTWSATSRPQSLEIHDILGRRIRVFELNGTPDLSQLSWDGTGINGRPVASGVYFARLIGTAETAVAKLVLLK